MASVIQYIVYGIITGSILTLPSLAMSIQYGTLRFPNFSIGEMSTLGAYLALTFNVTLNMDLITSAIISCILILPVGLFCEYAIFRPLRKKGAGTVTLILASLGLAFILQNVIRFIWPTENISYRIEPTIGRMIFGVRIADKSIAIISISCLLVLAMFVFFKKTKIGIGMRAVSDNIDLSRVMGIDADLIINFTWAFFSVFSCLAGILIGLESNINPNMGRKILIPIFAVVTLGGAGNIYGALAGALIIGVSMEVSVLFVASTYKEAIAFVIMLAAFFLRSKGAK